MPLQGGQRLTVEDLLPGTRYAVEEELTDEQAALYRVSVEVNGTPAESASGTLDGHTTVRFTNLGPEGITLSVRKEWAGDDASARPDSVLVTLYGDGEPVGAPVRLSAENNWRYTWYDLDNTVAWTVDEVQTPDGYEKTVSVNTAVEDTVSENTSSEDSAVSVSSDAPPASSQTPTPPTGDAGVAGAVLLTVAAMTVIGLRVRRRR